MKHTTITAILFALPLALAVPASAAPPDSDADSDAEPTNEEALEDDILMVIDLPIAADEARTAGVDEADITEALDAAEEAGVSAGEMTEVLDEETEQVKAKGKRKAFGQWVKLQIADGVRGKELAAKIKERKEELAELTDEQKAAVEAKLAELGERHRARRQKVHELRKQLREDGQDVILAGKERHDKMMAEAAKRHAAAKAKWKAAGKPGKPGDKRDERLDAKQDKLDQRDEKLDAKQDKLDKRDEKLDAKQDKLDKRDEKLDAKQDKLDARADHKNPAGKGSKKGDQ
jgi:chromosome segregation ATPase